MPKNETRKFHVDLIEPVWLDTIKTVYSFGTIIIILAEVATTH
jgi:hypothetical protein